IELLSNSKYARRAKPRDTTSAPRRKKIWVEASPHPSRCARHPLPRCGRGARTLSPQSPSPALRERGDRARRAWWVRVTRPANKLGLCSWEGKQATVRCSDQHISAKEQPTICCSSLRSNAFSQGFLRKSRA